MNPNRKNLANAFLAAPITAAATTMTYQAGYGAGKPAVPYFDTLTPAGQLSTMGNSEIVEVTALSGDTATIVRARKGTDAKAFPAGTIASNGIYVEDKIGSENIDLTTLAFGNYSTSKKDTGFKWIDGRPVYKITVPFSTVGGTAGTEQTISIALPGLTISGIVLDYNGYAKNSAGNDVQMIPGGASQGRGSFSGMTWGANNMFLYRISDGGAKTGHITVLYVE